MTQGPVNPNEPPSGGGEPTGIRRTRWRIIPVALLAIFGTVSLLSSPIPMFRSIELPTDYGGGITLPRIVATVLLVSGSIGILTSAFLCWRKRWVVFTLALFLSIGATSLAQYLISDLNL